MKGVIAKIPHRHIVRVGKLLGAVLYLVARPHRRLVQRNIQFCYPALSGQERSRLSKRFFAGAGIGVLEICQSIFMSQQDLHGLFRIEGEGLLMKALEGNRGVIIVSGHLGNWELGLQFFSSHLGRPMTGVARKMHSNRLDRWLERRRTRFGMKVLDKRRALPQMTQTLRRGEMLGLLVDQSRRKQGVPVTFFGREATATPAPAMLALRCKSPVVPIFCLRNTDGGLTLRVKEPLEMIRTGDLRSDLLTNTQIITSAVEETVRRHPDQWFWILRPWKTAYPQLYSEWESKREKKKRKGA